LGLISEVQLLCTTGTNNMLDIKATVKDVEAALLRLNKLVHDNNLNVYQQVTIPINCDTAEHCFDKLVSWSYSLIYESLGKHYDFLINQAKKLQSPISKAVSDFKATIHFFRTFAQHSLFDPSRYEHFKEYRQAWFQELCNSNEPKDDDDWQLCLEAIQSSLTVVITCLENTVTEAINGEFKLLFVEEWQKIINRTYTKYQYEVVLLKVLDDHGLKSSIEHRLFIERYLSTWQKSVEILPDEFDFEKEVYAIIQRSIAKEEVIPINGPDLIKAGIPKSQMLGKCISQAKRIFYENPCGPDELIKKL
jgi:hypothetical protein